MWVEHAEQSRDEKRCEKRSDGTKTRYECDSIFVQTNDAKHANSKCDRRYKIQLHQ